MKYVLSHVNSMRAWVELESSTVVRRTQFLIESTDREKTVASALRHSNVSKYCIQTCLGNDSRQIESQQRKLELFLWITAFS